MPKVASLIALDLFPDRSQPVEETWPASTPADGALYRWLHFDVATEGFAEWSRSHLPPVAAAALTQAETRPRCEVIGDGIILNLRGINLNPGQENEDMVSIRIWATRDLVVSARVRRVFAAEQLGEELSQAIPPGSSAAFLARLAELLTNRIEAASLDLDDQTSALEEELTLSPKSTADRITALRLTAVKLRRYLLPQRDALQKLAMVESNLAVPSDLGQLQEIANRNLRSVEELEAITQRLTALQDYVFTQKSEESSRNSMILSIVAAIFLPLGFLTGLFGVNVGGMPGLDWPWAFAVLTGASIVIGAVLYLLFRFLRWF